MEGKKKSGKECIRVKNRKAETEGELHGGHPNRTLYFAGGVREAFWSLLEDTEQGGLSV